MARTTVDDVFSLRVVDADPDIGPHVTFITDEGKIDIIFTSEEIELLAKWSRRITERARRSAEREIARISHEREANQE